MKLKKILIYFFFYILIGETLQFNIETIQQGILHENIAKIQEQIMDYVKIYL